MNVTTLPNATDRTDLVEITADRKRWTPPRAAVGAGAAHQVDPARVGCPQSEARLSVRRQPGAERHLVHALHRGSACRMRTSASARPLSA